MLYATSSTRQIDQYPSNRGHRCVDPPNGVRRNRLSLGSRERIVFAVIQPGCNENLAAVSGELSFLLIDVDGDRRCAAAEPERPAHANSILGDGYPELGRPNYPQRASGGCRLRPFLRRRGRPRRDRGRRRRGGRVSRRGVRVSRCAGGKRAEQDEQGSEHFGHGEASRGSWVDGCLRPSAQRVNARGHTLRGASRGVYARPDC